MLKHLRFTEWSRSRPHPNIARRLDCPRDIFREPVPNAANPVDFQVRLHRLATSDICHTFPTFRCCPIGAQDPNRLSGLYIVKRIGMFHP